MKRDEKCGVGKRVTPEKLSAHRHIDGGFHMKPKARRLQKQTTTIRLVIALTCVVIIAPGNALLAVRGQNATGQDAAAVKIPSDQLDSLVAPIALYPDPLLSQTLVASTYPLEIVQL